MRGDVQYRILNPLEYTDWDERIAGWGSDSFFNTEAWARTLHDTYGYEPCYIVGAEDGVSRLLLPMMDIRSCLTGRRGVGLPFSDYGEPVGIPSSGDEALVEFLKEVGDRRRWRHFELRCSVGLGGNVPASATFLKHTLDLSPGPAALFERLKNPVRTAIRKAEAAGMKVVFSSDPDDVLRFYRMHCRTRRRHGLPPQPFSFFEALRRYVLAAGKGTVALAFYGQRVVAGAVFCHAGDQALFKYGASDQRFQGLRGSTMVMWRAIEWYAARGFRQLSFGRTAPANAGLRRFKQGWGATESVLTYVKFDFRKREFVAGDGHDDDKGYAVARWLPLSLLKLVGRALYKHIG